MRTQFSFLLRRLKHILAVPTSSDNPSLLKYVDYLLVQISDPSGTFEIRSNVRELCLDSARRRYKTKTEMKLPHTDDGNLDATANHF